MKALEFTRTMKPWAIVFDLMALGVIYLVPTFSHMLNVPLYFMEPMRLMVILALVHTSPRNAYFLAVTLPLFSFLVSGHPFALKTALIASELILMVWLFSSLLKPIQNTFARMFTSILLSKVWYYLIKFILIKLLLIDSGLISTPVTVQVVMLVAFSVYVYFMLKKQLSSGQKA